MAHKLTKFQAIKTARDKDIWRTYQTESGAKTVVVTELAHKYGVTVNCVWQVIKKMRLKHNKVLQS